MFEDYLIDKGMSRRTIKDTLLTIERFNDWLLNENVEEPNYNDVLAYINQLTYQPHTKNVTINRLKHYFAYQVEQGKRTDNPAFHIKIKGASKKVYQTLTNEELDNLFETYRRRPMYLKDQWKTHVKYLNMFGLIIYQGLRSKELDNLRCEDFNLHEGTIEIHETVRANRRKLKLESRQILPLVQYLEITKGKFYDNRIEDLRQPVLEPLKKMIDTQVSFQQIRASRITIWLREHDIRKVLYLTGFRYVSSLERYKNQDLENLKDAVVRFHPMG